MTKVLMVCMGNICRSPMACSVARHLARQEQRSADFEFDSAGTHAHQRQLMDARARSVLVQRKYTPVKTRSRQINLQDFQHFDLILAMDEDNLSALWEQCPKHWHHKLHLLLSYAPETHTTEVPDPYYGGIAGFEHVLNLCEAGVWGLLTQVEC